MQMDSNKERAIAGENLDSKSVRIVLVLKYKTVLRGQQAVAKHVIQKEGIYSSARRLKL